jgi:hypothetical protein
MRLFRAERCVLCRMHGCSPCGVIWRRMEALDPFLTGDLRPGPPLYDWLRALGKCGWLSVFCPFLFVGNCMFEVGVELLVGNAAISLETPSWKVD